MESKIENSLKFNSLSSLFEFSFDNFKSKPFLGTRNNQNYSFTTYENTKREVNLLKGFFCSNDFYSQFEHENKTHSLIAIYSKPCENAFKCIMALHSLNVAVLPISDLVTIEEFNTILKEAKVNSLIIDDICLKNLVENSDLLEFESNTLCNMILIKNTDNNNIDVQKFKDKHKLNIISYIAESNNYKAIETTNFDENKLIFIVYTTTLKSVLISEKHFLNKFDSILNSNSLNINENSVYYSLTSFADLVEYHILLLSMIKGACIGFCSSTFKTIFEDLQILKPTFIFSYPRIFQKIHETLKGIINKLDPTKKNIINKALKAKYQHYLNENSPNHQVWDKIVFNKIKNILGGKLNSIIISGHLPIHIYEFILISLGTKIVQIYGNVENCGIIAYNDDDSLDNSYLGNFLSSNKEIKSCSTYSHVVSYFNGYEVLDRGELEIKNDPHFWGFTDSKPIKEDILTGDYVITFKTEDSILRYKFIDKINNLLNTRQEYTISPARLEEIYLNSEFISDVTLILDEMEEITAVIILNKNNFNFKKFDSVDMEKRKKSATNLMYHSDKKSKQAKEIRLRANSMDSDSVDMKHLKDLDTDTEELENKNEYEEMIINPNSNNLLKSQILNSFKKIWSFKSLKNYELIEKIFILDKKTLERLNTKLLNFKLEKNRKLIREIYFDHLNNQF